MLFPEQQGAKEWSVATMIVVANLHSKSSSERGRINGWEAPPNIEATAPAQHSTPARKLQQVGSLPPLVALGLPTYLVAKPALEHRWV